MSFAADAARVRDESKSVATRTRALKSCVTNHHALSYQAAISYLENEAGATGGVWTSDQLLRAMDLLEESRSSSLDALAAWDTHRRREKAQGRRTPSQSELDALQSRPWMSWTIPQSTEVSASADRDSGLLSSIDALPFPGAQAEDLGVVRAVMPEHRISWTTPFTTTVDGERLSIPGRIPNDEVGPADVESLTSVQRTMLHCLYTRHHDGYVRQRHLRAVIESLEPWVAPYVVKLIGEYIVEILVDIQEGLADLDQPSSPHRRQYGRFVADNRVFFALTRQRVESYWQDYYRSAYTKPSRSHQNSPTWNATTPPYPGFLLIESLEAVAGDLR